MKEAYRPLKYKFVLYLLPGLLIYSFVVLLPILSALRYGFYSWTGGAVMKYLGFGNYRELIGDRQFWAAFKNNIYIIILDLLGQVGLGFVFAVLLGSRGIFFRKVHRIMCYFPATLSAVVVGFVWTLMYNYEFGLINAVLRGFGLEKLAMPWLDLAKHIIPIITVSLIWQYIGYYMIIILAALTSISPEILEMASIDGATGVQKTIHITFPMIKSTIGVCVMLCIAGNMKGFENIYVMTNGGPGNASMVTALYAYKTSFLKYNFGYGAAISIGIMILSFALIFGSRLIFSRRRDEG
jgi:raffinose/stachyose/melibiose transport system permease protein